MSRWSLSHIFSDVSLIEFKDYTEKFTEVFEAHCGTECIATVKLYSGNKWENSFWDDDTDNFVKKKNEELTFYSTENVSEVTEEDFGKAIFADVWIAPIDKEKAPETSFAHLQVKGNDSSMLTFFAQSDKTDKMPDLVGSFGFKVKGDGYTRHNTMHKVTAFEKLKRAF